MQQIIDELKGLVTFKDTTEINDIVLIAAKEPQMLFFAHVGGIERDNSRKEEWWHVDLTMLSLPVQKMTWTLRTEQMTGKEIFTMGGNERFVQAVDLSSNKLPASTDGITKKVNKGRLKRVK